MESYDTYHVLGRNPSGEAFSRVSVLVREAGDRSVATLRRANYREAAPHGAFLVWKFNR
jgi:hypothetical protein